MISFKDLESPMSTKTLWIEHLTTLVTWWADFTAMFLRRAREMAAKTFREDRGMAI
jgi:hypothetical protein